MPLGRIRSRQPSLSPALLRNSTQKWSSKSLWTNTRSRTIRSPIPTSIQALRSRGLELVTVSALLGQPPSTALSDDNDLLAWVTKQRSLAQDYVPSDLMEIAGVPTTRAGLRLRREALARLTELW